MTNKFFFAPPGQGKSIIVTGMAVDRLDHKKSVASNYPIVTPDKVPKSSRLWEHSYIYKPIFDTLIIIDEAQQEFDSTVKKTLDPDEDTFFATTGQNGNDVLIISQGITRVTAAVRQRMNEWHKVRKVLDIPFIRDARGKFGYPLLFHVTVWESLEDMQSNNKERIYYSYFVWFNKRVAMSYNTTFFRNKGEPFIPQLWTDYIREHGDLEQLTKRVYAAGQKSIPAATYRYIVSSRYWRKISNAYLSSGRLRYVAERSKVSFQNVYEKIKNAISRIAVFSSTYFRGKRKCSSSCPDLDGKNGSKLDARDVDSRDRSDTCESSTSDNIQNVLSGDDETAQALALFNVAALSLAGFRETMEGIDSQIHEMGQGEKRVPVQQENCDSKVAGDDTKST